MPLPKRSPYSDLHTGARFSGPLDLRAPEDQFATDDLIDERFRRPVETPEVNEAIHALVHSWPTGNDVVAKAAAEQLVSRTRAFFQKQGVPVFAHPILPPQFARSVATAVKALPHEARDAQLSDLLGKFEEKFRPGLQREFDLANTASWFDVDHNEDGQIEGVREAGLLNRTMIASGARDELVHRVRGGGAQQIAARVSANPGEREVVTGRSHGEGQSELQRRSIIQGDPRHFNEMPQTGEYEGQAQTLEFDPDRETPEFSPLVQRDRRGTIQFTPVRRRDDRGHYDEQGRWVKDPYVEGYIVTERGTKVVAKKNLSSTPNWRSNCHGFVFADGEYWIDPGEADKILTGDGYAQLNLREDPLRPGDVVIYRDAKGNPIHSAVVVGRDSRTGEIVVEGIRGNLDLEPHRSSIYRQGDGLRDKVESIEVWRKPFDDNRRRRRK